MAEEGSFRQEPLESLTSLIADPGHHSGGGSVAAITAALAGALAVMIARLSANRKANREALPEIEKTISEIETMIDKLHQSADADSKLLVELMTAYRNRSSDRETYVETMVRATESTVSLGEEVHALLLHIEQLLPYANRFTVSDLGAAAAICQGALTATLLTADINVRMWRDAVDDTVEVDAMAQRMDDLLSTGLSVAGRVESQTRDALAGKR